MRSCWTRPARWKSSWLFRCWLGSDTKWFDTRWIIELLIVEILKLDLVTILNYPLSLINLFDNWSPSAQIGTPVVLLVYEVLMFSVSPICLNVTHKSKANAHSMEFCFILGRSGNNILREADQTWSLSEKEKKRPQVKFFSWYKGFA